MCSHHKEIPFPWAFLRSSIPCKKKSTKTFIPNDRCAKDVKKNIFFFFIYHNFFILIYTIKVEVLIYMIILT